MQSPCTTTRVEKVGEIGGAGGTLSKTVAVDVFAAGQSGELWGIPCAVKIASCGIVKRESVDITVGKLIKLGYPHYVPPKKHVP